MNTIYLNGIYQAKSENLINIDNIKNLDKLNLINHLKNIDYGSGSKYQSFDDILNYELKNIREELKELSNSNLIGDIFYLDEDLTNIKIAYKSVFYNIKNERASLVSRFDVEHLIEFFKTNNDAFIHLDDLEIFLQMKDVQGENLKEVLERIEVLYYDYIYQLAKKELPFVIEYIETRNFNRNFLTFLKFKHRKDSAENLKVLLLPQNSFDKFSWLELFELSNDQIVERLNSVYFGLVEESLKDFFETNDIDSLKHVLSERLTEVGLKISYNLDSAGAVFYYLKLKENEINNLRWLYYANK